MAPSTYLKTKASRLKDEKIFRMKLLPNMLYSPSFCLQFLLTPFYLLYFITLLLIIYLYLFLLNHFIND